MSKTMIALIIIGAVLCAGAVAIMIARRGLSRKRQSAINAVRNAGGALPDAINAASVAVMTSNSAQMAASMQPAPGLQSAAGTQAAAGAGLFSQQFRAMDLASRTAELDKIMEAYYRHDVIAQVNAAIRVAADGYNAWAKTQTDAIEAGQAALESDLQAIHAVEAEIKASDEALKKDEPADGDAATVQAYNRRVQAHNALIARHKALVAPFKERQAAHNQRVEAYNQEAQNRKNQADGVQKQAGDAAEAYQAWSKNGPERFFSEVNRAYAEALKDVRPEGDGASAGTMAGVTAWDAASTVAASPGRQLLIERIRRIRDELAARAKKEQASAEHGLLLVDVKLAGGEPSLLMVDCGATVSSLSPEMVEILGIQNFVGAEEELILPNNIRIKAPQLLIPKIEACGKEAEYIKGVVLSQIMPGVDGCLGLSFLYRFDFTIEKSQLILSELKRPAARIPVAGLKAPAGTGAGTSVGTAAETGAGSGAGTAAATGATPTTNGAALYDVFICHKSEDYKDAKIVYDALTEAGRHPFLSEVSGPQSHNAEFARVIDDAIECAMHFVVICSSRERVESPWVQSEWRMFDTLKRSGKKKGNIIPMLCGTMKISDLPLALRRYNGISLKDAGWKPTLMNYLPATPGAN